MPKRIFLVHPTLLAMPPVDQAFKTLWPDANILNVLDESLYNDIPQDGTLAPEIYTRLTNLFRHCELSRADGIVFSGSTFGPAVTEARKGVKIPVLRIEEAMMDDAAARGGRSCSSAPRSGRSRWCAARSMPRRSRPASR